MIGRLLAGILACVVLAWVVVSDLQRRMQAPLAVPDRGHVLLIEAGDSLRTVADRLDAAGVLANPRLLLLYGRWSGMDQKVHRGEYLLQPGLSIATLLPLLQSGRVIQYQVTLPEGITLARALEIFSGLEPLEVQLDGADDSRVKEVVAPYDNPEGLFFPDSYNFTRGTTDLELLQRAHRTLIQVLKEEWEGRPAGLPYESPYEALIMASIIERETGVPSEREQIAGVFVRRLQRAMRLQTDPAVIYGLGAGFDGNLTRDQLADESNPYNTYRHHGLPPTPIALPGRASIHAALHPAEGEALYFVARGDGGHEFSTTLAEHKRAVRKYQLRRREDYRSSPAGTAND